MVQSGQFAVLEVLGERLKIDIFNTMMQTREEAELHESRGSAKGIEDLLSTVFAEASFDRE